MKKGLFHNLLLSHLPLLLTMTGLLISLSAPAQSTAFSNPLLNHNQSSPEKIVAGSYSSNRLKGSSRRKFTPRNRNKIRLESKIPRNLGVANYSVRWSVKSLKGRNKKHKARGKIASMSLSPGKYRLTMQIGNYKEQKVIHVSRSRNKVQSFNMPIKAGLLKVTTGSSKASLGNAVIKVTDHRGKVVATSKGKPLKRLLKSGTYTVTYHYGSKQKGRNKVRITNGSVNVTKIKMPVSGKVRISAYEKGNQPLMKSTSWVITDSSGKVVKRTKRHNIRMSLYPGTYTAHLTVAGKKKSKKFRIKSGQKSNVKIRL